MKDKSDFRARVVIGLGLLFYFLLFVYCLAFHMSFSVMGVSDERLTILTLKNFLVPIILFQLKILAAYLVIGFLAGLFAFGFTRLLSRRWSRFKAYGFSVGLIILVHFIIFFRAVALYPQLFTEFLYDRGGWGKVLQVIITDHLGPSPFVKSLWILGIGFIILAFLRLIRAGFFSRRSVRIGIFILAVAGLLYGGALFLLKTLRPPANRGPNLLVLAGDSLRPDHLSFNGYHHETSPSIDGLARAGVSFDQAYAQLPRTFPSWLCFLTGEYPFQHGITTMFPSVKSRQKKFITLASILKDHGFSTAVVSDFAGDIFSRIELGFETVRAPYFNFPMLIRMRSQEMHTPLLAYLCNRPGRRIFPELGELANFADPELLARDVIEVLESYRGREKFFMLVFFSATHFPYSPPHPYYKMFTDPGYRGIYKYCKPNLINVDEEIVPDDIAQINGIFDGGIKATDDAIAMILAYLEKSRMAENTIVMFTADHGENMYEHEHGMGHGEHLRGSCSLRIPWVIYDPRHEFRVSRISSRVRSIDFMPTVLELLGLEAPGGIPGQSLIPLLDGMSENLHLPVYAETGLWFIDEGSGFFQEQRIMYPDVTRICWFENYFDNELVLREEWNDLTEVAKHRMLIKGKWKIIYCPLNNGVKWELYDLEADPEELNDLSEENPGELDRMRNELFDLLLKRPGWTVTGDYFLPEAGVR